MTIGHILFALYLITILTNFKKGVSGFSRLAWRQIKNKVVPLHYVSYNASSCHPSGCAYRQLRRCQF